MNIKIKALILSLIVILSFSSCESNDKDSITINSEKKTSLHFNIDKGPDSPISYANDSETELKTLELLIYSNTNNDINTYTLKEKANIIDSLKNKVCNYTTKLNEDSKYKFVIIANDNLTNISIDDNYSTLTTTLLSKTFSNNTNTSDLATNGIPMVGKTNNGIPIKLEAPYSYDVNLIKALCKLKIENENSSLSISSVQLMQVPSTSYVLTSNEDTYVTGSVNSKLKEYKINDSYYFFESKASDVGNAPCLHIAGTYTKTTISSKAEYTIPLIKDGKPIELKRNYIYTVSFTTESNRSINSATLIEHNNEQNGETKNFPLDINN